MSGYVIDIALSTTKIYVGGFYVSFFNLKRPGLASFELATGSLTIWIPDIAENSEGIPYVNSVSTSTNKLYAGGYFDRLGDEDRNYYAEYSICPPAPVITLNGSILSATASTSYQWYKEDKVINGATSQTLEISLYEYGTYSVNVILNGCNARSSDFVYLITNAELMNKSASIKVFPNPAHEELFIEVPVQSMLTVLDMMGRKIKSRTLLSNQSNRIETGDLITGTYVFMVKSASGIEYFKILKTQ
jgi:hypothetical protein